MRVTMACLNWLMATRKWELKELCTDEPQNATVCKVCSRGTVKAVQYSVMWLLQMLSTSQVIVLKVVASTATKIAGLYGEESCIQKSMSAYVTYTTWHSGIM